MSKPEAKRILLESVSVAVAGLIFAITINAVSPRGLSLARDYFPAIQKVNPVASAAEPTTPEARLKEAGLQTIGDEVAAKLVSDPRYGAGLIIFVDAREEDHYLAGHIPGAFEYDRYHPEKYLAEVLAACQAADQIVVYCNGGDCEDSKFAALALKEAGVPGQKLYIYVNGIRGWVARKSPVETGLRQSGTLRQEAP